MSLIVYQSVTVCMCMCVIKLEPLIVNELCVTRHGQYHYPLLKLFLNHMQRYDLLNTYSTCAYLCSTAYVEHTLHWTRRPALLACWTLATNLGISS